MTANPSRWKRACMAGGANAWDLLGMRERLEMVGGRFDVESAPGKGTTITAQYSARQGRARE